MAGRLRLTIAGSMGLIALVAISLSALAYPTALAASGVFSLTVGILFAATVAAMSLPGRRRAIWSSFALCGGGYLTLGLLLVSPTGPQLVTTPLIEMAHERIVVDRRPAVTVFNGPMTRVTHRLATDYWTAQLRDAGQTHVKLDYLPWAVRQCATSLLALVAAATGGLFAARLTTSYRRPVDPSATIDNGHP
jgi:hypothetical protein